MKKQMKMMMSIMLIIVMSIIVVPSASAADYTYITNFSVLLSANSTAERGKTVDVIIKLGEFTNIGKGVNSFMADLEYDKTKLSIESSQIVSQNSWDTPTYENNKLLTLKGSMITEEEAIMKMTFTVNADAGLGKTTITVKNAEASSDESDFIGKEDSIDIEIIEAVVPPQEDGGTGDEGTGNEGTGNGGAGNGDAGNGGTGNGGTGNGGTGNGGTGNGGAGNGDAGNGGAGNGDAGNGGTGNGGAGNGDAGNGGTGNGGTGNSGAGNEEDDDKTAADKNYNKAGLSTTLIIATVSIGVIALIMHRKNKKYEDII